MRLDVKAHDALTPDDRYALQTMREAVYPPDVLATAPGRHKEWEMPQYRVFVRDDAGRLVSHVGLVVRDGTLDGTAVRIGGVGGVLTHPAERGKGYASAGMARAAEWFAERDAHFGLLVCRLPLVPLCSRRGWRPFGGAMLVEQGGTVVQFTLNEVMTLPVRQPAPRDGEINLYGRPW